MSMADCPVPKLCSAPGVSSGLSYGIAAQILYNGTDGSVNGTYGIRNGTAAIDYCCALNNGTISTPMSESTSLPPSCFIQCAVSNKALQSSLVDCLDKNDTAHGCYAYDYNFDDHTSGAVSGLIELNRWTSLLVGLVVLSAVVL